MTDRALVRAFPALKDLPRLDLGTFPTPVQPLELSGVVPSFRGRAWVKREDASAEDIGGNKIRKLELVFGDALDRGCRTVVTMGGIGSNHCLVTAYYAADAGLETQLVVFPHAPTPTARRTLRAIASLGPRIVVCPSATASPAVAAAIRTRLRVAGGRPYLIPPGGCSPAGTLGWVDAGLEIAEQVRAGELDEPDAVFVPYGSGGSAAGLVVGLQLGGLATRVEAVRVYDLPGTTTAWLRRLAKRAVRAIARRTGERPPVVDLSRVRVAGGYLGRGYAEPTEEGSAAREVAAGLGLTLEPTYSAKAFAAFLDAAAAPARREQTLLFVLTYDARIPEGLLEDDPAALLPRGLRRYL